MVVTQLVGGLGNQLFQYSIGRALAEKHRTRLKLHVGVLGEYRLRRYALTHFRTNADVLTESQAAELGLEERPAGVLRGILNRRRIKRVVEKSFTFDPTVLATIPPCYLIGYWQSPKYFESIEPLIRKELSIADPLDGINEIVARHIESTTAVAVHVRRGDYVTNPDTNRYHGTCSPEYYRDAEDWLKSRVGSITLFVFSDDPDWVRGNLHFTSPSRIVDHNGPDHAHEDLRLMSLCPHHIIANSTFSWWGAWLSLHQDKIVIAPRRWFTEAAHSTEDLIPRTWVRL
jgi:hypothetical protein